MNLLQCGAPKSGNFWLYKILQEVLRKNGLDTTSFIQRQSIYSLAKKWDLNYPEQCQIDVLDITDLQYSYRISSIYRMPIEDVRGYVEKSPHIWSHSPFCKRTPEVLNLLDKKIYIIRDPRDRAISASKYYCSEYMLKYFPQEEKEPKQFLKKNFNTLMHEWVWHVYDYIYYSEKYDIHVCYYENFLVDFTKELSSLLEYLNIAFTATEKTDLENAVAFNKLKIDNPKHLNKGKYGLWKEQLSKEQIEMTEIIAGPLMDYLNYNNEESGYLSLRKNFNKKNLLDIKEEILQSQRALLK